MISFFSHVWEECPYFWVGCLIYKVLNDVAGVGLFKGMNLDLGGSACKSTSRARNFCVKLKDYSADAWVSLRKRFVSSYWTPVTY